MYPKGGFFSESSPKNPLGSYVKDRYGVFDFGHIYVSITFPSMGMP